VKVLVIDDEPQIRRALRVFLEQNHHEVYLAASGEEGLDQAALMLPELVILDLAMPGLNGYEVCKQLRTWSKAPIIVLSVRDQEEDKIKALDMGADDYLTKPLVWVNYSPVCAQYIDALVAKTLVNQTFTLMSFTSIFHDASSRSPGKKFT